MATLPQQLKLVFLVLILKQELILLFCDEHATAVSPLHDIIIKHSIDRSTQVVNMKNRRVPCGCLTCSPNHRENFAANVHFEELVCKDTAQYSFTISYGDIAAALHNRAIFSFKKGFIRQLYGSRNNDVKYLKLH